MIFFALIFCIAIAALGGLGIVSPFRLLGLIRRVQTPVGIYVVAGVRLLFGLSLLLAADESRRASDFLRILGVLIIVAGVATPLFGLKRYRKLLEWWAARGELFIRSWALCALAFGLILAWLLVGS